MRVTDSLLSDIFVKIPPGSAKLGCREHPNRFPEIDMTISRSFEVMRRVVTQAEWRTLMGTEPWLSDSESYEMLGSPPVGDALPAINLSQTEAFEFAKRASVHLGKECMLLPEVFWEYACRAGSTSEYYWGDDPEAGRDYEWSYWEGSWPLVIHEPGGLKPNRFGLYDMAGNINELVQDRIRASDSAYVPAEHYRSKVDFVATTGPDTVLRGANILSLPLSMRSGGKIIVPADERQAYAGVRLACIPWLRP
jgi:formylglycine-generating enzyme required for sulfatase activity